jgi:hypothetical protein
LFIHDDSLLNNGHDACKYIDVFSSNRVVNKGDVQFSFDVLNNVTVSDSYMPNPLVNDADVIVNNNDVGLGTRGYCSPYDCQFNYNFFDFGQLDHLFNYKLLYCFNCVNIRSSFISFIHNNLGFIQLGPFVNISNFNPINSNSGDGVNFKNLSNNISSYLGIQSLYKGIPNFISKSIPLASHINIKLFGELLQGFHDIQVLDLIQYGFPLDLDKSSFLPNLAVTNHGSANQFPAVVDSYLSEEIKFGSILGPFSDPPFRDLHCSPLMTAHKDGNKRRIIVDLSFTSGQTYAVNTTVSKSHYCVIMVV